jgi:hypothetical protein
LADRFARGFEDIYKTLQHHTDNVQDADGERVPTVDEKIQMSYEIFKIAPVELARVLTMLEDGCPYALSKKVATDEVLINFDAVPAKIFHEVHGFILTCQANAIGSVKKGKKRKD